MRIAEVEALLVGSETVGANLVVRIRSDSGLVGLGQAGAWGYPDAVASVVSQFRGYLLGQDPFRTEHIQQVLQRAAWLPLTTPLRADGSPAFAV